MFDETISQNIKTAATNALKNTDLTVHSSNQAFNKILKCDHQFILSLNNTKINEWTLNTNAKLTIINVFKNHHQIIQQLTKIESLIINKQKTLKSISNKWTLVKETVYTQIFM